MFEGRESAVEMEGHFRCTLRSINRANALRPRLHMPGAQSVHRIRRKVRLRRVIKDDWRGLYGASRQTYLTLPKAGRPGEDPRRYLAGREHPGRVLSVGTYTKN